MSTILIARTSKSTGRAGFTLLEMLLAISIFAILIVLITGILGQVNGMWIMTQAQNQQQQAGRVLLNFLARDINKAMLPLQTSNPNSLEFVINPSLGGATYSNHDTIFFQAPVASNPSPYAVSEVAEVGYFVQWQGTTAQLCRFFVNPIDMTTTPPQANANYLIYSNPTAWITSSVVNSVAPGTSPSYQGLLAENVVGLWINAYDKNGNSICPSGSSYDSRTTGNLPAVVDVSILVLTPAAAKRVSAGAVPVSLLQSLVQAGSYTNAAQCMAHLPAALLTGANCFTTRVQLANSQ
jgi:prepilin-type N-terminal cleavage/methylation domain-containing protein